MKDLKESLKSHLVAILAQNIYEEIVILLRHRGDNNFVIEIIP